MSKNNYASQIQAKLDRTRIEAAFISRTQTLDKVVIALGQMGLTPDELARFEDEYIKVEKDFCSEVIEDSKADKRMVYAKATIDRAIKQYVREDRFVPYEERYGYK